MRNLLTIILFFCLSQAAFGQQEVLNPNDPNLNAELNDTLQQINNKLISLTSTDTTVGSYFGTNGILTVKHGGTGQDFSAVAKNAFPYFSAAGVMGNVGIGTVGSVLTSNGSSAPTFTTPTPAGLTLKSTTTVSAAASSSAITLTSGKAYRVIFKFNPSNNGATFDFIMNADTGTNYWLAGTGSAGAASFVLSSTVADTYGLNGFIDIYPNQERNTAVDVNTIGYFKSSSSGNLSPITSTASGIYTGAATITSITFRRTDANTMTGTIWTYEYLGT